MKKKWFEFMQGRYGQNGLDKLSRHLNILALVFLVMFLISGGSLWGMLTVFNVVYFLYRNLSKDWESRRKELESYERLLRKPKDFVKLLRLRRKEGKDYKFFKCECGTILRVPKCRGQVEITCPKCKRHTFRKT